MANEKLCRGDANASARAAELASSLRQQSTHFSSWARGYGVIQHNDVTQLHIHELAAWLVATRKAPSLAWVFDKLVAADRLASAAMWLVVHMTYADRVDPSGQPLHATDFKAMSCH